MAWQATLQAQPKPDSVGEDKAFEPTVARFSDVQAGSGHQVHPLRVGNHYTTRILCVHRIVLYVQPCVSPTYWLSNAANVLRSRYCIPLRRNETDAKRLTGVVSGTNRYHVSAVPTAEWAICGFPTSIYD